MQFIAFILVICVVNIGIGYGIGRWWGNATEPVAPLDLPIDAPFVAEIETSPSEEEAEDSQIESATSESAPSSAVSEFRKNLRKSSHELTQLRDEGITRVVSQTTQRIVVESRTIFDQLSAYVQSIESQEQHDAAGVTLDEMYQQLAQLETTSNNLAEAARGNGSATDEKEQITRLTKELDRLQRALSKWDTDSANE